MFMNYPVVVNPLHKSWASYTQPDAPAYISLPHMILAGAFKKPSSPSRKPGQMNGPTWMSPLATCLVNSSMGFPWRMPWLPMMSKPTRQGSLQGTPN